MKSVLISDLLKQSFFTDAHKLTHWLEFEKCSYLRFVKTIFFYRCPQVIGWAAFAMFSQGMSQESAIKFGELRKISKEEMDRILNAMSYDDRSRYESLQNRLKDFNISDADRQNIVSEMAELIERYR